MEKSVATMQFADVTFILEDKEVPAHKLMLVRCPYFAAMFSSEMKERSMDKIRIETMSHHIFLLVLKYLYTDSCEINFEVSLLFGTRHSIFKFLERDGTI
jgi:hypothetical protein